MKKPSKKKKKKKKKSFKQRLLDLFPKKGDRLGERIRKIVFLGSVVAIVVCGYIVGDYYYDLWSSKRKTKNLMEIYEVYGDQEAPKEETPADERVRYLDMLPGARKLWEQNHDIVGVISIPNTPINNPVMQAEDNKKYLNMKFDLTENIAGELFLDYRNHFDEVDEEGYIKCKNSDNLVIYGHNMYDDQMFGCLKYYNWRDDYYGLHPVIDLRSNYENYKYKIFAFFILDAEDETDTKFDCWNNLDFDSEEDFYNFVNEAKRRTIRLNNVDVKYGDPLLTLSTCNTTLPDDRGRIIIMARRVRDGEDPIEGTQDSVRNPNIKWPNLYYQSVSDERYDPNAPFEPYGPTEAKKTQ
ncbi:MAG: class B sortase [Ruminococcus sp.]|nr:class B sortase [Ruminococcus sp.]